LSSDFIFVCGRPLQESIEKLIASGNAFLPGGTSIKLEEGSVTITLLCKYPVFIS